MKKWIVTGIIAFFVLVILLLSIRIVRAGQKGVLLKWGAVQEDVLGEGIHFILPVRDSIKKINVRIKKFETKAPSFSNDLQQADAVVALNYHIRPDKANLLWKEIGRDYEQQIISPAIQESVKAVTARFKAQALIENRNEVKKETLKELSERLEKRYISCDDFSIVNFDFSDEYEHAIEQKQVTQQNVLKAENELKQKELEAKQRIATAQGEAEAIRIQAEAISKQGGDAYLKVRAIDKWDGKMPQILTSNESGLLFNIPTK